MAWKPEWVAVGISILALAGTGGGIFYQHQQLAIAQEEWASARGTIEAAASLHTYNGSWKEYPRNSNVPEAELNAPVELYALVEITNSGANATAIKSVGIQKSQTQKLQLGANCPAEGINLSACPFPVKLPEFGKTTFYVPLSGLLRNELQCNEYVRDNGIVLYVERVDGDTVTARTDSTVSTAAYCQNFTPPQQ